MSDKCSITIPKGYATGYRKGQQVAEASEEISLSEGTHYLLARNGRGKTTLLRTLAGSLRSLAGEATVEGRLQFVPEDIFYDKSLNAKSILNILIPKKRRDACYAFADEIELDVAKSYAKLSTGNQRKISWLMCEFSCEVKRGNVLLLDEPFTGLDSYVREKMMEYWERNEDQVCRLVSCHPDFDSMKIESSVLISNGAIRAANSSEMNTWGELKGQLH